MATVGTWAAAAAVRLTTSRRAASVSYGARTYFTLADLCNEMCMEKAFVCIARVPGSVVAGMVAANKGGIPMQCVALHGRACATLAMVPRTHSPCGVAAMTTAW